MSSKDFCILCHSNITLSTPELQGYRTCTQCDLTWYSNASTDYSHDEYEYGDWDRDFYNDDKVLEFHKARKSAFGAIAARLSTVRPQRGCLLDIGTGVGLLMAAAAKDGWIVEGVEPSTRAAECAQKLTGAPVHIGFLENLNLPEARYDAVTVVDTLRNVPDLLAFLRAARRLIRPGGILLIRESNRKVLRNIRWCKEWLKGNSVGQSRAAIRRGFDYQGFSPVSLLYTLRQLGLANAWVEPSPVFAERVPGVGRLNPLLKRSAIGASMALYRVSGGRIIVSPNLLAFGQAPTEKLDNVYCSEKRSA